MRLLPTRLLPALAFALLTAACADAPPPPAAPPATTPAAAPEAPAPPTAEAALPTVTVYKSPTCGCCSLWAAHLRDEGFPVEEVDVESLAAVRAEYGIPDSLAACHTAVVDGYIVEGHVPAGDVKRLLAEKPEAAGLAVPGMPLGSPGMEVPGRAPEPYAVYLIDDGRASVFARH